MKRIIIDILKKIIGEDNFILWRLKKNEKSTLKKINREIKEEWKNMPLCFDIGANIGNYTLAYSHFFKTVIAIEPQESCFTILKKRFAGLNNIILEKKAIGSTPGVGKINIYNENTISSMSDQSLNVERFNDKISLKKTQTVEVETISAMINRYGKPNFIKIDVEGYEFEVISGLSEPISFIQFECNWPENKDMLKNCLNHISKLGSYKFEFDSIQSNSTNEFFEKIESKFKNSFVSIDILCSLNK